MVFFALSGLVLFLSFKSVDAFRYTPYIIKRFMRLYPPFAFAILGSALLCEFLKHFDIPQFSTTYGQLLDWKALPSPAIVATHLAMTDRTVWLDPPMWSLVHEMRISLIFPLLAIWVMKDWRRATVGSLFISLFSTYMNRSHPSSWQFQPFATLQYIFLFTAGAALALNVVAIREQMKRCPGWARLVLWLAALIPMAATGKTIFGYFTVFSALLVVALCMTDPLAEILLMKQFPKWLARVSYSLYLVHMPVLLAMVHLFWGKMPLIMLLALVVIASLIVAEAFHRIVEQPSMDLGRRLADRFSNHARRMPSYE